MDYTDKTVPSTMRSTAAQLMLCVLWATTELHDNIVLCWQQEHSTVLHDPAPQLNTC